MKNVLMLCGIVVMLGCSAERVIDNVLTVAHQTVPGTRVSLIPPEEFLPSLSFPGFQHIPTGSSIFVVEMPASFYETTSHFTEESLKGEGIDMTSREELVVNAYDALLIYGEQHVFAGHFKKIILCLGDSAHMVMLTGVAPSNDENIFANVEEAVLSCVYDPEMVIDPLASLSFGITTGETKFKLGHVMMGTVLYTTDGKVPTESSDKSNFSVGESLSEIEITDPRSFTLERLNALPIINTTKELQLTEIQIDGLEGYEIVTEVISETSQLPELLYQVMLFEENRYYIMVGRASHDYETHTAIFRQIAQTFERK